MKIARFLVIPASLFIGTLFGMWLQSAQTDYWHGLAYRVADNSESVIEVVTDEFQVCLDVVAGDLTYEQGTEKLLQLDDRMVEFTDEQEAIIRELDSRK